MNETWNTCPDCGRKWADEPAIPGLLHRTRLCSQCAVHGTLKQLAALPTIDPEKFRAALGRHCTQIGNDLEVNIEPLVADMGLDPTPANCELIAHHIHLALGKAQRGTWVPRIDERADPAKSTDKVH